MIKDADDTCEEWDGGDVDETEQEEPEPEETETEPEPQDDFEYQSPVRVVESKPQTSLQSCKCYFSPDELREMSDEMARKIGEIDEKEAEKKAVASQFKADIEAIQKEINWLAQRVRNKFEYRQVKCQIDRDWTNRKVTYVRTDTGEIHRERAMTVDELQTELDLERN